MPDPSDFLQRIVTMLPRGRALDVACGDGRNGAFLVRQGWEVTGIDRDAEALQRARDEGLHTLQADLEDGKRHLGSSEWDVVIVVNYLWRDLFPQLAAALRPGGALVYETFTRHPTMRTAYLLRPNELLHAFRRVLQVARYEAFDDPASPHAKAHLLGFRNG